MKIIEVFTTFDKKDRLQGHVHPSNFETSISVVWYEINSAGIYKITINKRVCTGHFFFDQRFLWCNG